MGLKVYRTGPMGALLDEYEKAIDGKNVGESRHR